MEPVENPFVNLLIDFGKSSFIIGSEKSGYRHLYEYDYTGKMIRKVTDGNFNITNYYGRDARGNVYVQCTKRGAVNRNVARVDSKGAMKLLNDVDGTENASFSSNFEY